MKKNTPIRTHTKNIFLLFLMLLVVFPFATPLPRAKAGFTDDVANWLTSVNTTIVQLVSTWDKSNNILAIIGKRIAARALNKMTEQTVRWINTGFEGNPQFVDNIQNFKEDAKNKDLLKYLGNISVNTQAYGVNISGGTNGNGQLYGGANGYGVNAQTGGSNPYGRNFAVGVLQQAQNSVGNTLAYTQNDFLYRTRGTDSASYNKDFKKGGWGGWLSSALVPANNPIGYRIEASTQIQKQRNSTDQSIAQELQTNQGFLNQTRCEQPGYELNAKKRETLKKEIDRLKREQAMSAVNAQGPAAQRANLQSLKDTRGSLIQQKEVLARLGQSTDDLESQIAILDQQIRDTSVGSGSVGRTPDQYNQEIKRLETATECDPSNKVIKTPGGLIKDQLNMALSSKIRQTELGQAFGNSIGAVFDALANRLITDGVGALTDGRRGDVSSQWEQYGKSVTNQQPNILGGDPFSTPDIVITPLELSLKIEQGIQMMSPEIDELNKQLEIFDKGPLKLKILDMCLPGPDLEWESRLGKAFDRMSHGAREKAARKDDDDLYKDISEQEDGLQKVFDIVHRVLFTPGLSIESASKIRAGLSTAYGKMREKRQVDTQLQETQTTLDKLKGLKKSLYRMKGTRDANIPLESQIEVKEKIPSATMQNITKEFLALERSISDSGTLQDTGNRTTLLQTLFSSLDEKNNTGDEGLLGMCERERKEIFTKGADDSDTGLIYKMLYGHKSLHSKDTTYGNLDYPKVIRDEVDKDVAVNVEFQPREDGVAGYLSTRKAEQFSQGLITGEAFGFFRYLSPVSLIASIFAGPDANITSSEEIEKMMAAEPNASGMYIDKSDSVNIIVTPEIYNYCDWFVSRDIWIAKLGNSAAKNPSVCYRSYRMDETYYKNDPESRK